MVKVRVHRRCELRIISLQDVIVVADEPQRIHLYRQQTTNTNEQNELYKRTLGAKSNSEAELEPINKSV